MAKTGSGGTGNPDAGSGADPEIRFEEALARLEELVGRLEVGELPLEETILTFEEGQRLLRICTDLLNRAELRVKEILRRADGTLEESELLVSEAGVEHEESAEPARAARKDESDDLPF